MFTQMVASAFRWTIARLVVVFAFSVLILSTTLAQRTPAATPAPSDPAQAGNRVYLPVVVTKAEGQTPAPTPTTPAPAPTTPAPTPTPSSSPAPQPIRTTLFADQQWKTSSASIAVDDSGGIHHAYYYYEPEYGDSFPNPTHAVYSYCAARCDDGNNWHSVALMEGKSVNEVQVAVTRDGRPRLLIRASRKNIFVPYEYHYAECNVDCTSAAGWKTTHILNTGIPLLQGVLEDDQPQRYFALDPQDRPRFVYADRNFYEAEPDRYGTYYVFCDDNCTDAANWRDVHVGRHVTGTGNAENFEYPSLTFTSSGQPRIVAGLWPLEASESGIYYVACDSACDTEEGWRRVLLGKRGQGSAPGWDIEVDAQDRPRIALYPEQMDDGSGRQLHYAWCDDNCLDAASWQRSNINAALQLQPETGGDPDLELDPEGRPRIAMVAFGGNTLGYVECNVSCETGQAQWKGVALDNADVLAQEWPVPFAPTCQGGLWTVHTPILAFDPAGNLRVTYDATYHAKCWWSSNEQNYESYYQFALIQRAARTILVTTP